MTREYRHIEQYVKGISELQKQGYAVLKCSPISVIDVRKRKENTLIKAFDDLL